MLVEFSVENYRSIRERVTLSLIATRLDAASSGPGQDNLIRVNKNLSLLRSVVIYGANASGKTNILRAFSFAQRFVIHSASEGQPGEPIGTEPFLLDEHSRSQPSTFEIVFLLDNVQYRYGFSVTRERVIAEWLYYTPTLREATLFTRDGENGVHIPSHSPFKESRGLDVRTRPNALFLSVAAHFNGKIAGQVWSWFRQQSRAINADVDPSYLNYTLTCIQDGAYRAYIAEFLRELNLDITGISVVEKTVGARGIDFQPQGCEPTDGSHPGLDVGPDGTRHEIRTRHVIREANGAPIGEEDFPLQTMESEGTRKIVALCGPLFDVLTNGWVLFVDEIDTRLHPLITAALVRLFNSSETNPKQAQLICATHDTGLLDRRKFRRDQVYFTEKENSATRLYSLAEFKLPSPDKNGSVRSVRADASFERDYIQGRYGAVPYLGDLRRLFIEELQGSEVQPDGETEAVPA